MNIPSSGQAEEFADLVAAVAADRDRAAFARLFDHFAPRLNGYLIRLGEEPAGAEEIVQDVMSTLWRKAALFDRSKSSVATWLYRIARNRRIDVLRRNRDQKSSPEEAELLVDGAPSPDDAMDARQREAKVRLAIAGLPQEQVALVRLAFFEGMSHSEIAAHTGLPLGTVKSRIRLAFGRLRRELEADGIAAAE